MSSERFEIDYCKVADVPALKLFIHKHWKPYHIMSVDDALFQWQHFDREHMRYGFVLARDANGTIVGVLGFISDRFFRKTTSVGGKTIWLAIWKVLENVRSPGLGLRLRNFLEAQETPALIAAVGLNPRTVPLYRAFGYQVGVMEQHYIVNSSCRRPSLIGGFDGRYDSGAPIHPSRSLKRVEANQLKEFLSALPAVADVLPVKDFDYIEGRYVLHPSYAYHFYGITEAGRPLGLLVTRVAEAAGVNALRIVDVVGPATALEGLRSEFQSMLLAHRAEYADLYCFGFTADSMERAGFLRLNPNSSLVVPNYFEPYTQENVQITLAYKLIEPYRYFAFKGDADQDRPNILRHNEA